MARFFRCIALCLVLTGLAGAVCASTPEAGAAAEAEASAPVPPPAVADFKAEEFAAALLKETNRIRLENGRRPLRRRWELEAAAGDQAEYMALTGRVQHASAIRGQGTPAERVRVRGLHSRLVSENVAAQSINPEAPLDSPRAVAVALVAQWMASPPHRANMLNREYAYFGGAVRFAPMVRRIWAAYAVQVFAAQ